MNECHVLHLMVEILRILYKDFKIFTHLVLGRRTANFASAKKTFDSHSPEAVCNLPVLAVMTS
jgi:hypothetical protein